MLQQPSQKYRRFEPIQLEDRQWPSKTIDHPPIWMSTDLRDGNQSLIDPMSIETKLRFFKALVEMGFKEIEVGFPSASQTEFDFVRLLIEGGHIPADVTIEVLTQARKDLIDRTVESVVGAHRAVVHMYNATAPEFRQVVYKATKPEVIAMAEQGTRWVQAAIAPHSDTEWVFQYSAEAFSGTELDFARDIVDAVSTIWQPTPENKMILNLPATIEMTSPNTFADQVEWMCRNIQRRDSIVVSVHPHNDRGTAVAAAELAIMAGADRVEGCLFGNGERTGNVDIVTLALNLYSQGIHPGLDFSQIDQVRQLVEECNNIPVHPRHPYAGEFVYTAFSGSHQDAIKKGFEQQQPGAMWNVPYLPMDPADLGRSYESVVRVNSQSGKGGVSFLLSQEYGLDIPRRLQIEFSRVVQNYSDEVGKEVRGADIVRLFKEHYLNVAEPIHYQQFDQHGDDQEVNLNIDFTINGEKTRRSGKGAGPLEAAVNAIQPMLTQSLSIIDYHEHSVGAGADGDAVCYLEMRFEDSLPVFGVGRDRNIAAAAIKALINGVNRHYQSSGSSVLLVSENVAKIA